MATIDPGLLYLHGQHAADRLMQHQKMTSDLYLHGDPPPTPNQVAAVLHSLADHTLWMRLTSVEVQATADDRAHLGPQWRSVSAIGRSLQAMGDWLEQWPE